jgi:hypothetical protein
VAVARSGTSIDDLGALLAFAVSIGARVERVLERGDDIAVADRRLLEADQLLAVGRPREVDLLTEQRQEDLPPAAELAEWAKISRIASWIRRSGSKPRPISRCQM